VDRPRDVFHPLLAGIGEAGIELTLDVLVHRARDRDAAGLGQLLQARRDIDPVTVEIVLLDHHIAEVDPDSERDPPIVGNADVAADHRLLDVNGAGERVDHARELRQHAVAHQLDHAPAIGRHPGVDQLAAERLEGAERARLIGLHQPRVADYIGSQYGG
jgi:hypothetical protein